MRRREFIVGASMISALGACDTVGQNFNTPEFQKLRAEFPYEVVEVSGSRAWEEWSRLRDLGHGWPIILGGEEDFLRVAEGVVGYEDDPVGVQPVEDILAAASRLEHPASLLQSIQERYARYGDAPPEADVGEWPADASLMGGGGLTVPVDILSGRPFERVYITTFQRRTRLRRRRICTGAGGMSVRHQNTTLRRLDPGAIATA